MTDLNVEAATGAWLGADPQAANMQLQKMQAQGLSLDNASKAITLKQDQLMSQLTQARMQKFAQAKLPDTSQPTLQDLSTGAASHAMDTAQDLFTAGKWQEGIEMESKASTMLRNQSAIQRNQAMIEKDTILQGQQEAKLVSQLVQGVTDESTWQQAKMQYQSYTGHPLPKEIQSAPYSPKIVEFLKQQSMTAYQSGKLKLDKLDTASKIANRESEMALRKKQQDLKFIKDKAQANSEGRQAATGGLAPKASDLQPFIKAITDQYPAMDETEAPILARDLFERTASKLQKNSALSKAEAMQQAYNDQKRDGVFASEQQKTGGASPQYPITLKAGAKLEDGKYYTDGSGRVKQYNAGGVYAAPSWTPVSGVDESDDVETLDRSDAENDNE